MIFRLQTYLPTAILAGLIFYFGFHALTGDRGLLLTRQRQVVLAAKQAELIELRQEFHRILGDALDDARDDAIDDALGDALGDAPDGALAPAPPR